MEQVAYSDIYNRIKALSGVSDFTTQEQAFILSFVNRRANLAYEESDFWPRWLVVGQARTSTNGVIPYAQTSLPTIDTFLRIHKTYQPFYQYSSIEVEYYVAGDGAHLVGDTSPSSTNYVTYKKAWDGPYTISSTNIPQEWQEYICQGAYADFLRMDQQVDKALAEEKVADNIISNQLMKVDVTRSVGMVAHRISTHVNRSYRRA
jgi:hypothetical protein